MITLDNINEHGLDYIIMAINDIIEENGIQTSTAGLQVGETWLTPETCYWLYKIVCIRENSAIVSEKTLRFLKESTNSL